MKRIAYTKENLGKRDPQYGGDLTDVSALPVGTEFYVCNGAWYGKIVDVNGAKCIQPSSEPFDEPHRTRYFAPVPTWPAGDENNILAISDVRLPRVEGGIETFKRGNGIFIIHPDTEEIVSAMFFDAVISPGEKTMAEVVVDASEMSGDVETRTKIIPADDMFTTADEAVRVYAKRSAALRAEWLESMRTVDGLVAFATSHDLTPLGDEDTALNRKRAAMRDCFGAAAKRLLEEKTAEATKLSHKAKEGEDA